MNVLQKVDPEIAGIIRAEQLRQSQTLELIASENHVSLPVLVALGSVLTDKYAEGYPGKRYYCGYGNVDEVERFASSGPRSSSGPSTPTSSPTAAPARTWRCTWRASSRATRSWAWTWPTAGTSRTACGSTPRACSTRRPSYGVDPTPRRLDMDEVREQVLEEKPDLLVAGRVGVSAEDRLRRVRRRSPRRPAARCWPTSPTSPGWSSAGCTPRRFRTRRS